MGIPSDFRIVNRDALHQPATVADLSKAGRDLDEHFARELAAATAHADAKEAALDTFGYGKPTLTYSGPFSVYFNRHVDAPRVWIIAARDRAWEVNVVSVDIRVAVATRYEPRPQSPDHNGPPAAWFEGVGFVQVDAGGKAVITTALPEAAR